MQEQLHLEVINNDIPSQCFFQIQQDHMNLAQVVSQIEKDFDSNPASLLPGQDPIEDDEDTVILRPLVVDVSFDKSVNNLRLKSFECSNLHSCSIQCCGRDMATNVIVQDVVTNGLSI
ncbi:MAG: hypothetical protein IPL23_30530 [Saprospiraceae bacterium]|nr:hypothetical protein [Saprospiraceae bacterium]